MCQKVSLQKIKFLSGQVLALRQSIFDLNLKKSHTMKPKKEIENEIIELLLNKISCSTNNLEEQKSMDLLKRFAFEYLEDCLRTLLNEKKLSQKVFKRFNLSWITDEIPYPALHLDIYLLSEIFYNLYFSFIYLKINRSELCN